MDKEQKQLFNFYCLQLKITTFKQLFTIIKKYNVNDENELINVLCKLYNSDEYLKINNL